MSDFGLLATRFNENTILLRRFDDALRFFKEENAQKDTIKTLKQKENLLEVLKPVSETLAGLLSRSTGLDEQKIVDILKRRQMKDWQRYRDRVTRLTDKLSSGNVSLTQDDFEVLNDVADAIDTECASLFRRISGRQ